MLHLRPLPSRAPWVVLEAPSEEVSKAPSSRTLRRTMSGTSSRTLRRTMPPTLRRPCAGPRRDATADAFEPTLIYPLVYAVKYTLEVRIRSTMRGTFRRTLRGILRDALGTRVTSLQVAGAEPESRGAGQRPVGSVVSVVFLGSVLVRSTADLTDSAGGL